MKDTKSMKRFFITIAVLGVFAIYSIGIRHKSPVLSKPPSPTTLVNNSTPSIQYKDGTYTGTVADAYYGSVQVSATISGGKITDIKFLQFPNTHSTSVIINQQAMPYLVQEAVQSQSGNVQIISGATFTSQAFTQSLNSALSQAQA